MANYYTLSGTIIEPLTLADAKLQLRIDHDFENAIITAIITEARSLAEDYTGRLFTERDLVIHTQNFIEDLETDYSPINSISTLKYKIVKGGTYSELVADTDYKLRKIDKYSSKIDYILDPLPTLPEDSTAVEITAKVGYTAAALPASVRSAIKLLISYLYENRDDTADEKQRASQTILRPFKRWN